VGGVVIWPLATGVVFLIILVALCWAFYEKGHRDGRALGSSEAWHRWQKAQQARDDASAWRRKGGST
jgi:hypothetical protein